MKKLLLMLVAAIGLSNANAQLNPNHYSRQKSGPNTLQINTSSKSASRSARPLSKTTAVPIASENFGTGTDTTLPTGWTSGSFHGTGSWHWSVDSSTSSNSLGYMHSSTAANGWMIFDADSINFDCSCSPAAWLQSPAYNCTGHPTVRLNFEEYYGHVDDTCEIWVSTDPAFATYTRYPVEHNNNLDFGEITANTELIHVDISSAAAGHAAVYIRYVYFGDSFYDLSWMVDDMTITELEPHDAGISKPYLLAPVATAYNGTVSCTPLAFTDSIYPGIFLSNYGANAETNVPGSLNIIRGGTSVYTQSNTFPNLPYAAKDSVSWFPAFKPTSTGLYTCAYASGLPGDADAGNNMDSLNFTVTDSIWMQNDSLGITNFIVNNATFFSPASTYFIGTRFDVPAAAVGDTISGFGVGFSPLTNSPNTGSRVSVQLYSKHKTDTAWTYEGTSVSRPIVAADISTFTSTHWADFRIDTGASGGVGHFVLHPGTSYAAVLQCKNLHTDMAIFASKAHRVPGITGTIYVSDTSFNDGSHTFRNHIMSDTGFDGYVPFIRMYFGTVPVDRTAVPGNNRPLTIGQPWPDPANNLINIPFVCTTGRLVTVRISDMTGKVVATQNITATAGKNQNAAFNTADLPDGTYIYSIAADGFSTNGRFVITH